MPLSGWQLNSSYPRATTDMPGFSDNVIISAHIDFLPLYTHVCIAELQTSTPSNGAGHVKGKPNMVL